MNTRIVTTAVETVDRKPRYTRTYGHTPAGASPYLLLMPYLIAVAALLVAAAIAIPTPSPYDYILIGVTAIAGGLYAWTHRHPDEEKVAAASLSYISAAGLIRTDEYAIAVGPQLAVARFVGPVKVKLDRTGHAFIGGKPISRVAPYQLAADAGRAFGGKADVMIAVEDWDSEPTIVADRNRKVWIMNTDDLAGVFLGAPDRIDEDVTKAKLIEFAAKLDG